MESNKFNFKQVHDLEWVLQKFYPVPDWHFDPNKRGKGKGIVYYTSSEGNKDILRVCRNQIKKGMKEKHIVSASLKPLKFGKNIVLNLKPGYLTMAKQILEALVASTSDTIFFCEHDVLYHPSHFDFYPYRNDTIYYNTNVWRVNVEDGHSLYCDDLRQLSGLVAFRETLIKHYEKRIKMLEEANKCLDELSFNRYVRKMGFEPGTHNRAERVDDLRAESYQSKFPNLDLRHGGNLTPSRWRKDQFRNERFTKGWTEKDVSEIDGWKFTETGSIISI